MSPLELCQWIQETQIGTAIRESVWIFPIILAFHSLGLTLSVGTVLWLDMRLLGIKMREQPVSEVYQQLMPWMLSGFAIMCISGTLLFSAQAARCYENVYCRTKILLLVLPVFNTLIYHLVTGEYPVEGRTMDEFRRLFKDDPTLYVPRVFWELTSESVLTS